MFGSIPLSDTLLSAPLNVTIREIEVSSAVVTWEILEGDPVIGFAVTQQVPPSAARLQQRSHSLSPHLQTTFLSSKAVLLPVKVPQKLSRSSEHDEWMIWFSWSLVRFMMNSSRLTTGSSRPPVNSFCISSLLSVIAPLS